ncbi:hypothetical protein C8D94_10537 [Marinirhabdus gelatinilytica]|uniref:Uncharacterized protein n=1 Tax=Marinirhabdus gelatinilytica TaxID=1703343 RepID=A0A370Q752_9FLAO|nr:hypothetical protein C8D94_10537 [Marinirhabdus gelatinilytica]
MGPIFFSASPKFVEQFYRNAFSPYKVPKDRKATLRFFIGQTTLHNTTTGFENRTLTK